MIEFCSGATPVPEQHAGARSTLVDQRHSGASNNEGSRHQVCVTVDKEFRARRLSMGTRRVQKSNGNSEFRKLQAVAARLAVG